MRYLADRRGTYSIDKAADLLQWRPEVTLDAGLGTDPPLVEIEGIDPRLKAGALLDTMRATD